MMASGRKSELLFSHAQTHRLPTDYAHESQAWMNSDIFSSWLRNLDSKMNQGRSIALFLDNCRPQPTSQIH